MTTAESLQELASGLLKDASLLISTGIISGKPRLAADGKQFPVIEPSSGSVLIQCADLGRDDFLEAINTAEQGTAAFYESTTARQRGSILTQWHKLILQHTADLATILSLENGKTLAEAKAELASAASYILWFAEEASRSYGDTIPSSMPNTTVLTFREPLGTCGIITPWNFPAAMIARKVAPAIAAGCSVVIKPPKETPLSSMALARLALMAGVPPDCYHVIPTTNREAAQVLATSEQVKKISFTGSTGVGKFLTGLASGTMKRVSMELGGNAPFIVFDDADLDLAVQGLMASKFRCSGQTCVCANRILIQDSVKEAFLAKLIPQVAGLRLGRGIDPGTTQGPLVNAAAVKEMSALVEDALAKGAILHTGGQVPPQYASQGFFYEPTVLSNVTTEMKVANVEIFGPIAAIATFSTEEEAIKMAKSTEYGLAGYFFSRDIGRVARVGRKLECGMVGVNTGLMSAAETPFGGDQGEWGRN
ncbi:succinate-semialdehyde dehydrogenase [Penicillium sp. IBT 18751x]|nr:succinate-semialdehyde dehydrogenase [Penicillium sp. IBT 18751x]